MVGNIWEWCLNKWPVPYELTNQGLPRFGLEDQSPFGRAGIYGFETTPTIESDIQRPVVRGGSWYGLRDYASCAVRDLNSPHDRRNDLGFRLVRSSSIEPFLSKDFGPGLESKVEDVEPFLSKDFDQGLESTVEEVELKPKKNPTSLITRYGWMFLAMLLALLVIAVAVDQSR